MGNAKLKEDPADDLAFADELAPGCRLMHGQYTIESFLNAGGFGITYSARDSLDRRVVIKECFPGAFCRRSTMLVQARSRAHQSELASIVRLFVQEARSLAKMDHPNIVGVHQVFEENNTAYMALDYVEGRDLLDMIEEGKVDLLPDQIETVLRKVLDAVKFIHAQNILHRDISPDNILLDQNNNPVLIDFGAAREEATKQSRVLSALRVVKDGYSPQEFYISGSEQGPYSDLYALGATFYHLITGDLPPNSQARLAAVAAGEKDPYRPLADRVPRFRRAFLEALDTSLEILPKDRLSSASAWLSVLDGETTKAKSRSLSTSDTKTKKAKRKFKKAVLLGTVAVVAFAAVGLVATQLDIATGHFADAPQVTASAPTAPVSPIVVDPASVENTAAMPEVSVPAPIETVNAASPSIEPVTGPTPPLGVEQVIVTHTLSDMATLTAPAAQNIASADQIAPVTPVDITPEIELSTPFDIAAPDSAPLFEMLRRAPLPQGSFTAPALALTQAPFVGTLAAAIAQADTPPGKTRPDQFNAVQDDIAFLGTDEITTPPALPDDAPALQKSRPATDPAMQTVERFDVPGMRSGWDVFLPADASFAQDNFPHILSVNSVPVTNEADFNAALRDTSDIPTEAEITVRARVATSADKVEDITLTLPVVYKTEFINGFAFKTTLEDDTWITRVVSVPEANRSSDLKVGDILIGHITSNTRLNDLAALPRTVQAALENGEDLTFAVFREGNTWAVALPYSGARLD